MSLEELTSEEIVGIADEFRRLRQHSPAFRYLLEMVERERERAVEEIAHCDPGNAARVAELQAEIRLDMGLQRIMEDIETQAAEQSEQARNDRDEPAFED